MIWAALTGLAAGGIAGMLGVGGGILFVPALAIFLDLGQVDAEATSLLAILPVSLVGVWRQRGYDNVRLRDGLLIGTLSAAGALGGVAAAHALPERALELAFAGLALLIAGRLAPRSLMKPTN